MSQELAVIKGRTEIIIPETRTVSYKSNELYITSFSGPKGSMIQISPDIGTTHIQLEKEQVIELIHTLIGWL